MSIEAMKQVVKEAVYHRGGYWIVPEKDFSSLCQAIAEAEKQEPVTFLPDGSAFGVMSFPLPDDHWLYAPNEYRNGEYEPIDLPKPILTHALRDEVVSAVRYAVRGATMRGKEKDFDPDALVQNAVYALCGPYNTAQPKRESIDLDAICQDLQEKTYTQAMRIADLEAKLAEVEKQEPYGWISQHTTKGVYEWQFNKEVAGVYPDTAISILPVYTHPQQSTWVGLTDEEMRELEKQFNAERVRTSDEEYLVIYPADYWGWQRAIEAKLKEKNT